MPSIRWTSKVVNPRAFARGKTTSRVLTTWCSSHMKAITVLLYRSYSKMFFLAWMFCFADYNKLMSGIENAITEPVFRDCRPGDDPLSLIYMSGLFSGFSPSSAFFPKKHVSCFITLKKYVRYNNALCMWKCTILQFDFYNFNDICKLRCSNVTTCYIIYVIHLWNKVKYSLSFYAVKILWQSLFFLCSVL